MPENTRDMAPDRTGLPTERRTDGAARGSWLADGWGSRNHTGVSTRTLWRLP